MLSWKKKDIMNKIIDDGYKVDSDGWLEGEGIEGRYRILGPHFHSNQN